ncbi:hypothetical protein [Nocardia sp. NPDC048505]|uniref:hypothetical protein n=1 Tax=unclassified Nocardia TaxID=2637762 RepID=UPI0033F6BDF3
MGAIYFLVVDGGSIFVDIPAALIAALISFPFFAAAWSLVPRDAPVVVESKSTVNGPASVLPFREASFFLRMIGRTRSRSSIELTPDHVLLNYWEKPKVIPWDHICAIGTRCDKAGSNRTNVITIVYAAPGHRQRFRDIGHSVFATDPTRVYHLLRFYQSRPECRSELGTELSSNRFREGRFSS